MIADIEQTFINKFVIKDKQERYLTFLAKDKTRKKFITELYHFNDFNWKLFQEIPGKYKHWFDFTPPNIIRLK